MHLRMLRRQHRAALVAAQSVNPYAVIPPFVITPPPIMGVSGDRPLVAPPIYLNKRSGEERAAVAETKAEAAAAASAPPPGAVVAMPVIPEEPYGETLLVPVVRRHKRRHHKHRHHRAHSRPEHDYDSADAMREWRRHSAGGSEKPHFPPIKPAGYPGQLPGQTYYGDPRGPAMDVAMGCMGMGAGMPMNGMPGMGGMHPGAEFSMPPGAGDGMDHGMAGMQPYMGHLGTMPMQMQPRPMPLPPGMAPTQQPLLAPHQAGNRDSYIDHVGQVGPPAYDEASDYRNPGRGKRGILKRLMGRH